MAHFFVSKFSGISSSTQLSSAKVIKMNKLIKMKTSERNNSIVVVKTVVMDSKVDLTRTVQLSLVSQRTRLQKVFKLNSSN